MDNRNPVFSRLEERTSQGAGFAYDEGRSAFQQAGQSPYPGTAQADPYAPGYPMQGAPTGSIYEPITSDRMTMDDVLVRTGLCFAVLLPAALFGWYAVQQMPALVWIAAIVGMVLGFVNIFRSNVSPPLILAYAAAQGLFLGGISWTFQHYAELNGYEGNLVTQAVLGTLVAFAVMLALYKTQLVRVDGRFMKILMVAMVSYLVIALASMVSSFFGVGGGWGFYGVGGLGLLLCVAGVALASFSLMLDFESITQGIRAGLPERESWRMAFGLLVTLIWLYLEILRLLAILASSRD